MVKRQLAASILVLGALGCTVGTSMTDDMLAGGATTFATDLSGDAQSTPVNTATSGTASLELSDDGNSLDFIVSVSNGIGITQAHLHVGAAGEDGPIVANLLERVDPGIAVDGVLVSGALTADDLLGDLAGQPLSALVEQLRAGNIYVNVHSEANPAGEVRGQVSPSEN